MVGSKIGFKGGMSSNPGKLNEKGADSTHCDVYFQWWLLRLLWDRDLQNTLYQFSFRLVRYGVGWEFESATEGVTSTFTYVTACIVFGLQFSFARKGQLIIFNAQLELFAVESWNIRRYEKCIVGFYEVQFQNTSGRGIKPATHLSDGSLE